MNPVLQDDSRQADSTDCADSLLFQAKEMKGEGGGVSRGRAARVGIGIGLRFRGTDVVVGAESVHRTLFARFDCTIHAREHAGVDYQAWRARVCRRCSAG